MSIRLVLLFVSSSLPANHIITMQNTLEQIGLHPAIIHIIRSDSCPDAILASGMILLSKAPGSAYLEKAVKFLCNIKMKVVNHTFVNNFRQFLSIRIRLVLTTKMSILVQRS